MNELKKIRLEKMREMIERMKKPEEIKIGVSDEDFYEKVLKKSEEVPVVVDFWAVWCMPCLMLGPALEKLAEEYKGKFVLAKANVDQAGTTASTYKITSIPAVKMFKNREVVDSFVGALPEPDVRQWLDKNLKS